MYTHELINLIKTFTSKELMWFDKFLKSPYFNNRKRIISLFKILKGFHPEFESKNLTKDKVYRKLYGDVKYNDSTFRNLMSDLLKLALQFIKLEGIEKNETQSSFFLTDELFKRGTYNLLRNRMSSNERILENRNIIDSDYFLIKYRILTDNFYINLLTKKVLKKQFVVSESEKLINAIVFILSYFILETLKHNDNLLKYSRSYNIKKNITTVSNFIEGFNFEKLISYIRENSSLKIPVVEAYYNLIKTFTNFEDEKYYRDFKSSLINNSTVIGLNDNNFLYSRLIDYCVLKMNLGTSPGFNIHSELFEINNIIIKNEYYKTDANNYLPFDYFRNFMYNCIALKKLDYMENIIKIYCKKLLPKHIDSVENYGYALLYFEKGMYTKALANINRIKFDQFVFKLDMKNLQLKISYELEQFESAISVIDTYKHFLKNNVLISESRRILHSNFLNYTYKLIQYRIGSQKINLNFIADRIEKSKNIFDKGWLLEKTNDLSRKKPKVSSVKM